jgi:PAS domain S-box-containing protein
VQLLLVLSALIVVYLRLSGQTIYRIISRQQSVFGKNLRPKDNQTMRLPKTYFPGGWSVLITFLLSIAEVVSAGAEEGELPMTSPAPESTIVMWLLISGAVALGLFVICYTVSLRFKVHRQTCLLREADQQLRAIVEVSPVPVIITRVEDGKIVYVNDNLAEMMGYEKEELIGKLSPDFYFDRNDRVKVLEILQRDGRLNDYEVRLRKKDGSVVWTIFSVAITDIGGERVILGGLYDITERKKTVGALRWERNFVSAVLDTAGALIVVLDLEGRVLRFNRACEITSGYNFMEVVGKRFSEIFIDPEELPMVEKQFRQVIESRSVVVGEYCWRSKDGSRRSISWANTVLSDEDDESEYVIAIGIDITEQKQAQEALAARLRFEEGLEGCSRALLEETDPDEAMKKALHCLLEASQTSRVYVFSNLEDPHDGLCARLTHEVCAEGVRSYLHDPLSRQIPYKRGFQRWRTKMSAGEAIE